MVAPMAGSTVQGTQFTWGVMLLVLTAKGSAEGVGSLGVN